MVEWLERLDYGAENRRKIMSSGLGFDMRQLENSLSVNPVVNVYLFRIREGYRSEKRAVPKKQWGS